MSGDFSLQPTSSLGYCGALWAESAVKMFIPRTLLSSMRSASRAHWGLCLHLSA